MKTLLNRWLPPLALMGLIFLLSARPRTSITEVYLIDFLIFKTLHMIEYALLYFFLFRALWPGHKSKKAYVWAFAICVLYAASDEIHQTYVPGREGRRRDVVIDTAGMLLMYSYIKTHFWRIKKYLP
jgi:VanZ family protein